MSHAEDAERIILRQHVTGDRLLVRVNAGTLWFSYQEGLSMKDNICVPVISMADAPPLDWQNDPESGAHVEVELLPQLVRMAWGEMSAAVRAELRKAVEECEAEDVRIERDPEPIV